MSPISRRRIRPADLDTLDPSLADRVRLAGRQTAGARRLFAVMAHHPKLLDTWLRFSGRLLLSGTLSRRQTELLVLRSAAACGSAYEWDQHVLIARELGFADAEFEALGRQPLDPRPFSVEERRLLTAADELNEHGEISAETWNDLSADLSDAQLVELCLLVGHYRMLAMLIASAGVRPEAEPDPEMEPDRT
jgi:alkylhydroperoxidase family enzyme